MLPVSPAIDGEKVGPITAPIRDESEAKRSYISAVRVKMTGSLFTNSYARGICRLQLSSIGPMFVIQKIARKF